MAAWASSWMCQGCLKSVSSEQWAVVSKGGKMREVKSYKDLLIWQKGIDLVVEVYKDEITELRKMIFGLISKLN